MLVTSRIWKPTLPRSNWKDATSRRMFFDNFALEKQFDPLNSDCWYNIKIKDVANKVFPFIWRCWEFLCTYVYFGAGMVC